MNKPEILPTHNGLSAKPASGRRRLGLQAYIGLVFGLLIILSSVLLGEVLAEVAKREVLKLASANLENLSLQMARELSTGMHEFTREILTQTYRERFRSPATSSEEMRASLDEFKATHPEFAFIGVADVETGKVIASTGGVFEGGSVRDRPVFEQGRKGVFVGDVHNAVRLAELLPRPANGEPLRFLDVAAPIADSAGKTFRVLASHVSWQWTDALRSTVLGPLKERREVEILLVDTADKVVLVPSPGIAIGTPISTLAPVFPTKPGVVKWADGNDYLVVMAPVMPHGEFPGFGWKVVARQPVSSAFAPVERLRAWFFSAGLVIGIIVALIAWWMAGRIIMPVRRLADFAGNLAADGSNRPIEESRIGEVAQMQAIFNRLVNESQQQTQQTMAHERQFVAFADSIPHLVWQSDASGRLEYANHQWLRDFGAFEGMEIGRLVGLMVEEDLPSFARTWRQCRTTGSQLLADARLRQLAGGPAQWYRIRGQAVRASTGEIFRWVGTITNINEAVLEAERTERALETERKAREEAEHVARMKDEFLATLSHELRTPLHVISVWSEIMGKRTDLDPMVARASGIISRNAQMQTALINDLLDMSAVTAGKVSLTIKPVDCAAIVLETAQSFQHMAESKLLETTIEVGPGPVTVLGDAFRLKQIVSNLISNAIKFSSPGGLLRVTASVVNDYYRIQVTDTGCGISPDFLPHVFDRFRQEDASTARKRGGIGLGLAIAKSLVTLHNGTIDALSEGAGKGCILTVDLPLLHAGPALELPPMGGSAASTGHRSVLEKLNILIVDDEQDASDGAKAFLDSLGAHVTTASSADRAIQLLAERPFDLLLCDIGMPDMDGYEFLRQIRADTDAPYHNIPAVALTAFAMKQDEDRARQAGFQTHLGKPVSMESLIEKINAVMGSPQARPARHPSRT